MSNWAIDWQMEGTAIIEADDEDEAESLAADALRDFTTYAFDEFEVDDTTVTVNEEMPDD